MPYEFEKCEHHLVYLGVCDCTYTKICSGRTFAKHDSFLSIFPIFSGELKMFLHSFSTVGVVAVWIWHKLMQNPHNFHYMWFMFGMAGAC